MTFLEKDDVILERDKTERHFKGEQVQLQRVEQRNKRRQQRLDNKLPNEKRNTKSKINSKELQNRPTSKANFRTGKDMKKRTYLALVRAIYDHQAVPTGGVAVVDDTVRFLRGVGKSEEFQLYFLTYFSINLQRTVRIKPVSTVKNKM